MVPYHPASNGVAKRTIRVLTSSVRAMLTDSGLPKSLWAEAFNTAVYGVKPDLTDLRAFSAPCAIVELV